MKDVKASFAKINIQKIMVDEKVNFSLNFFTSIKLDLLSSKIETHKHIMNLIYFYL
jgi:hypothetical protein